MSKPPIYANCPAGCRFETVHKEDVEKSVAVLATPMSDGRATATEGVLYKIKAPTHFTGMTGIPYSEYLPTADFGRVAVTVGTNIFLFGCDDDGDYSGRIQVFKTVTSELSDLEIKLPHPVRDVAAVAVGNDIYLFGGYDTDYSDSIIKVDTLNLTVAELSAKLDVRLSHVAAAAVGKKIYLFGGEREADGSVVTESRVRVFDVKSETLSTLSAKIEWHSLMGISRVGAAVIGEDIYLCGGRMMSETEVGGWDATNTILKYNTAKGQFEFVGAMKYALWGCAVASAGDYIFIAGGDTGNFNGTTQLYRFNVKEKSFLGGVGVNTKAAYCAGLATVGATCYYFGGGNQANHEQAQVKAWTFPTYKSDILIKWWENGKERSYSIPVIVYDEYKAYYTFEALHVSVRQNGTEIRIVYELNGERRETVVYGTSIEPNSVHFEISGDAVYSFNEGAKTIGLVGMTGAIHEVENLPENPTEESPSLVMYKDEIYILTEA